jgi:tRNA(adenine34) deaminase
VVGGCVAGGGSEGGCAAGVRVVGVRAARGCVVAVRAAGGCVVGVRAAGGCVVGGCVVGVRAAGGCAVGGCVVGGGAPGGCAADGQRRGGPRAVSGVGVGPRGAEGGAAYAASMRLALAAARTAGSEDVPVGAVVLGRTGAVLAEAANERERAGDPTAHAEVLALRRAAAVKGGWRLTGCTLVVTLEPCTMCAGALVLARVDRLIYGAADPKAGAAGSLWDVVRDRRLNHRPEVVGGVLGDECAALLEVFFGRHRR